MATQHLLEGAVTLDPLGWDGAGFLADDDFIIELPFGNGAPITQGLDQSSIVGGIQSLTIKSGATGTIGGGAAGPLIIDADGSGDEFISNHGSVTLFSRAGGDTGRIENYDCGPMSINNLQGGTYGNITVSGGTLNANESTVIENGFFAGGSGELEHSAIDSTLIKIMAGTWTLKRMPTTLTIGGTAVVIFDPDDLENLAGKTLNMQGGRIDWRAGAVPTVVGDAGIIDFSNNRRPFAPGGTSFVVTAATIIEHNAVDLTAVTFPGQMKRNLRSATAVLLGA